jgi:hypothetical protein
MAYSGRRHGHHQDTQRHTAVLLPRFENSGAVITAHHTSIPNVILCADLERMTLEHPEKNRNEHFTFTLTNEEGQRYYGICMRGHFRGEGRYVMSHALVRRWDIGTP